MSTTPSSPLANVDMAPLPQIKQGFGFNYWLLNVIEAGERLAFYTVWPIAAIYIMQATEPGGLQLTAKHKALVFLWFSIVQAVLPIITGGYADRYGFKKTIIFAMFVNMVGYGLMTLHQFWAFFLGMILVGVGASFFKPAIQGALAQIVPKGSSSLGWGIFYWVVNIGAFFGHLISPKILSDHSARAYILLFSLCAGFCLLNIILTIFFKDVPTGASQTRAPLEVLVSTVKNIFEPRLLAWLLIMSGFWLMMYQLWDSAPNFITDWVDSARLAQLAPFDSWKETGPDGRLRVPQQVLLSLNAFLIVALVVPISYLVRRMRSLSAMLLGVLAVMIGIALAGLTQSGWILLAGVTLFSLGEMLVGPKKSEYLALIAPAGKKGLYLGYVVIPTGIGRGAGSWLSGTLYGPWGEKATLAQRYLIEHTPWGHGRSWDGHFANLENAAGVPRSEAYAKLQTVLGKSGPEVTQILWDTYDPQLWFWLPFIAIGMVSATALFIFGRMARKWSDMNA